MSLWAFISSFLRPLELEQFGLNFVIFIYSYLSSITLANWPGVDHQGSPKLFGISGFVHMAAERHEGLLLLDELANALAPHVSTFVALVELGAVGRGVGD